VTPPKPVTSALPLPLPAPVAAALLRKAKQYMAHLMYTRKNRPLWNCCFTPAGLGTDVFIELLPDLVLQVRDRATNQVLAQTLPVEFGPQDTSGIDLVERFNAWREERLALAALQANDPQTGGES
jgi:hypothetical protein